MNTEKYIRVTGLIEFPLKQLRFLDKNGFENILKWIEVSIKKLNVKVIEK